MMFSFLSNKETDPNYANEKVREKHNKENISVSELDSINLKESLLSLTDRKHWGMLGELRKKVDILLEPHKLSLYHESTPSPDEILDVLHSTSQGIISGANMVLVDFHPSPSCDESIRKCSENFKQRWQFKILRIACPDLQHYTCLAFLFA